MNEILFISQQLKTWRQSYPQI